MSGRHAVFRADASTAIGTGHIIRCRTLAAALVERGWTVAFATRDLPDGLAEPLRTAMIGILALDATSTVSDEPRLIRQATGGRIDLAVADHYAIDADWLAAMRIHADAVMAIDDLADRTLPVDILLDQNVADTGRYDGLVPDAARLLLGPQYALVRPEFAAQRDRGRVRDGRIRHVHVFLGGADPDDVTSRAVEALAGLDLTADIVVGAAYGGGDGLRARLAADPGLRLHVNTDDMVELMDRADLAIGSPGSASWERCTIGLPTVLVAIADNQRVVERELVDAGAALTVGWHATVTAATIADAVRSLQADPARVADMARAAATVTDGRGVDRVIAAIGDVLDRRAVTGR